MKSIHVKLVKFDLPAKHWFYLNTSNVFTNPDGFKLSNLRRVSSFLFNMISFKLLFDFIQVSEDFLETSEKLF